MEGDRKDGSQGHLHEGDQQECRQVCQGRREGHGHEGDHQQGAEEHPGGKGELGHQGDHQQVKNMAEGTQGEGEVKDMNRMVVMGASL